MAMALAGDDLLAMTHVHAASAAASTAALACHWRSAGTELAIGRRINGSNASHPRCSPYAHPPGERWVAAMAVAAAV
jgi:hypothetical protein